MSTAQDELLEYIDPFYQPNAGEREAYEAGKTEVWSIKNAATADWACRTIQKAVRLQEQREATAAEEIQRINEWLEESRRKTDSGTAYLRSALESYMRGVHAEDPKRKSVSLPTGTLQLRKEPARWSWPDSKDELQGEAYTALMSYAREHGAVRVREELDKTIIKQSCHVTDTGYVVDENGELVPGVRVEETDFPTFSVKLSA